MSNYHDYEESETASERKAREERERRFTKQYQAMRARIPGMRLYESSCWYWRNKEKSFLDLPEEEQSGWAALEERVLKEGWKPK